VGLHLARGRDAPPPPSREAPSRSGTKRSLERVSVSLEGVAGRRPIPAPPTGAFNALTPEGVQVKGESMPLCAWESRPATAPPTPVARPSLPLCDAVWRGQQPPRGTVPHTPARQAHCTLKKGRRNPRRDNAQLLCVRTGRRRDVRPVGEVTSIAISPMRPPPSPRRHPDHCMTIPDAMEHAATGHLHDSHCASYGLMLVAPSNPHADDPRTSNLYATPSKPLLEMHRTRHDAPTRSRICQDNRLLRGIVRHVSTRWQNNVARL
jgi:hypothetical protein